MNHAPKKKRGPSKAMEALLASGEAVDVAEFEIDVDTGCFIVPEDVMKKADQAPHGLDFFDTDSGKWIRSIGRREEDDLILASFTTEFYMNPRFECLWLR